jgi:hypothetical protein
MLRQMRTLLLGVSLTFSLLGTAPPEPTPPPPESQAPASAPAPAPPPSAPAASAPAPVRSVSGALAYEPERAGHPLRVVAYVLHPVGVILDYLIFRPAWWLGSHEPLRTLFGVES